MLYDIEDPWGRFKFEPDSRPWNDQLAPALESAGHDRIFIATSRSDVAEASHAENNIQRWRARYLLVTSAALNDPVSYLGVRHVPLPLSANTCSALFIRTP
ncbi:MAG: hypothetical protein EOR99_32345 [Mesorhizobium sp.]|nr:MAG: hypothetical protein EOR99_32345 [Mesorhizobium sp.]